MNNSLKTLLTSTFLLSLSELHADVMVQNPPETFFPLTDPTSLCKLEGLRVFLPAKDEPLKVDIKYNIRNGITKDFENLLEKVESNVENLNLTVEYKNEIAFKALLERVDPNLETFVLAIENGCSDFALEIFGKKVIQDLLEKDKKSALKALNCAAMCGNPELVLALLAKVEPNRETLKCTIKRGCMSIFLAVLAKVEPDTEALNFAIRLGNVDAFKALLKRVEPNLKSLHVAIEYGNLVAFEAILKSVEPNRETLNVAIKYGGIDIFLAIREKVKPDTKALNFAMRLGNMNAFRALLKSVEPNLETLILAVKYRFSNITTDLLGKKIILDLLAKDKKSALEVLNLSIEYGDPDLTQGLLEENVKPNADTLNVAIINNRPRLIATLLGARAIPTKKTLNLAERYGLDRKLFNELLKAAGLPADETTLRGSKRPRPTSEQPIAKLLKAADSRPMKP